MISGPIPSPAATVTVVGVGVGAPALLMSDPRGCGKLKGGCRLPVFSCRYVRRARLGCAHPVTVGGDARGGDEPAWAHGRTRSTVHISQTSRVGGAGLLTLAATYGIGRLAYGLFVPSFREEFGLSVDVLGFYASAAQAGYLAATLVAGVITARLGPRTPVVTGCLLLTIGAATIASAPDQGLLAVGLVIAGTSAGGAWAPFSDAVDGQVPSSGNRRALALVNAGSPVGLLLASALVLTTGDRWRVAWWAFAAVGLVAAFVAFRVLAPGPPAPIAERGHPRPRWFLNGRSIRLFVVATGISITSGAYFAYAPDTAQDAGLNSWIGPAMWATLGLAGASLGAFGGDIASRYGLRRPLAGMLVLVSGSTLVLLVA